MFEKTEHYQELHEGEEAALLWLFAENYVFQVPQKTLFGNPNAKAKEVSLEGFKTY